MTGLNLSQVKHLIVTPVMAHLGATEPRLNTPAAINLVTGIGNKESLGYTYIQQIGGGPALSPWQMEPASRADLVDRVLAEPANARLAAALVSLEIPGYDLDAQMVGNLFYACALCRLKVWFDPAPLPGESDAEGLCAAWKRIWNTSAGAGVVDAPTIAYFQQAIDA